MQGTVPVNRAQRRANRKTNAQRVGWLGQLRVGQKLSLAAFAFSIPLTVLVSSLLVTQQGNISFTQRELSGLQQFAPLRDINNNLAGFVTTALRGDQAGAEKAAAGWTAPSTSSRRRSPPNTANASRRCAATGRPSRTPSARSRTSPSCRRTRSCSTPTSAT
ncbi:hypothetical protein [Deinococcus sp. JMULE3]|uniref:hypothetical protein n=1 Tax=Deinococcus sp. JMULE3 TaxID=2518341 RepID=UPI001574F77B|nr:hypothetical protein [Deinococcus sp. JMULE3]